MHPTRHNRLLDRRCDALVGALLALLTTGCNSDRITFRFVDGTTRDEAVAVDVYAVHVETNSGGVIGCPDLLELRRSVADGDLQVEQTTVPLPAPRSQAPLLGQLPQADYAFYAVARDSFDFVVARGCATGAISSNRALDLEVALATVPAPSGTLEPTGATQWLQHVGLSGAEVAPLLAVRARDLQHRPLVGIEVRARVVAGNAQLTDSVLQTSSSANPDEAGVAASALVIEADRAEVMLHARGLTGSPISFVVDGIANPNYQDQSVISVRDPVALLSGEFFYDPSPEKLLPDDLLAVLHVGSATSAVYWRGGELGWEGDTRDRGLTDGVTLAAAGFFDDDPRPDLAVVVGDRPLFGIYAHDDWLDDSLRNLSVIELPADIVTIDRILVLNVDGDPYSDALLSARTATDRRLLLYVSLGTPAGGDRTQLALVQTIALPGVMGDPALFIGDPDGDGDDDLLLLKTFDVSYVVPCGTESDGDGSGRYFAPAPVDADTWPRLEVSRGTRFVAIADLDEDGLADGVALREGAVGETARLQLAFGDGSLQLLFNETDDELGMTSFEHALVNDFNGDGHSDLLMVTAESPLQASLLGSDGSGRFAAPLLLDVGFTPVGVAAADVNRDGIYDIGLLGARCEGGSHLLVKISSLVAR